MRLWVISIQLWLNVFFSALSEDISGFTRVPVRGGTDAERRAGVRTWWLLRFGCR